MVTRIHHCWDCAYFRTGQNSLFLVLTARIAASGDKNVGPFIMYSMYHVIVIHCTLYDFVRAQYSLRSLGKVLSLVVVAMGMAIAVLQHTVQCIHVWSNKTLLPGLFYEGFTFPVCVLIRQALFTYTKLVMQHKVIWASYLFLVQPFVTPHHGNIMVSLITYLMYFTGAKFEWHLSNISRDILHWDVLGMYLHVLLKAF